MYETFYWSTLVHIWVLTFFSVRLLLEEELS